MQNSLFLKVKGGLGSALMGNFFSQFPDHNSLYLSDDLVVVSSALKVAFAGFHSIINTQDVTQKSWLIHLVRYDESLLQYKGSFCLAESAIALIPLIIYRYENINQLEFDLEQISKLWLKDSLYYEDLRIWSIFVGLLLKNNYLEREKNTKQLLSFCRTENSRENIKLINICLKNRYTLQQIEKQFKDSISEQSLIIYQTIYLFLSLSDYFELCLLKSTQISENVKLVATLTGFLLGIHNSYLKIPLFWRKYLEISPITTSLKIDQLSENFVTTWQGKFRV